jgi:DNA-binding MarR family transcriptional regulator
VLPSPILFNETQRINADDRPHILDSSNSDERFDRITRIAQHLLDTPSSFITLVDNKRVWFKSMYGCSLREEPRDTSFSKHAINNIITKDYSSRLFEVRDVEHDKRFNDNYSTVKECNTRYYLGFVIQSKDHRSIGTLFVTDTRPRVFSKHQKKLFSDIGFMAEETINSSPISSPSTTNSFIDHPINKDNTSDKHANKLLSISDTLASVQKQFNDSLKKYDTNYKDWRILNAINQTELASPHLISQKLGIAPSSATRKLDTLEIKRLIERHHADNGDRRRVYLTCSEKGQTLWRKGLEEANRLEETHLENISYLY